MRFSLANPSWLDGAHETSDAMVDRARARMITRPPHLNAYEFAVVAALRAQQLMAGCTPRLCDEHSATTMAQMEVAEGCVARSVEDVTATSPPCGWQR